MNSGLPPLEESQDSKSQDRTPNGDSVSGWIRNLNDGDADALQQIWNRYFDKLMQRASTNIAGYGVPPATVNAEDVAVSVFESIWRGAEAGRFANIKDRHELWWLLLAMTRRKVINHIRHATAARRFPGDPNQPDALNHACPETVDLEELLSDEPTPEYVATLQEEYSRLLNLLRDDKLRKIAVLKVEGYSNKEILEHLEIAPATLTRKLELIRSTWKDALQNEK